MRVFLFLGGLAAVLLPAVAHADEGDDPIVVTGQRRDDDPSTSARIDAATIAATINATNVEDTLKYLPSLVLRKRHIGDTQAVLATRTSGLGASARSLIYADGVLLSALIGNNNGNASPRWSMIGTEEIAQVEVLYGPFSAAYPGNSIGAVVNILTRMPETLEATMKAGVNVQTFEQYGTRDTLPSYQLGATLGDRFGPLALFAAFDHVDSRGQPLAYVTALRPASASSAGTPVSGGFDDLNRTGAAIRVLGASGIEHQVQDRIRLKAALELGEVRLAWSGGVFLNDAEARAETYLADATGAPAWAGSFNIGGRLYPVAASTFSGGVNRTEQRHWSHSLSATGTGALEWRLVATRYRFGKDEQRIPTTALPGAESGGAGTIARLDGTGWTTLDARIGAAAGGHRLSLGAHGDWIALDSRRFVTSDWIAGSEGALNLRSRGKTRTLALWVQDAWSMAPGVTLTLGARHEWWRAHHGLNFSLTPAISVSQPVRTASRFSPKVALAWEPAADWALRLSFGQAWRFPTVGELYQVVTTPVAAVPDPNLRPERARSWELAAEHKGLRLSLFNETIRDALISQSGPLNGSATIATFVQNVDATRARGAELAFDRRGLLPGFDLTASLTWADAITTRDAAFPAAVGKQLPSVPRWKGTIAATWHPAEPVALTAAARYASRAWGTLDNSDVVGNTWQGFYRYLVIDLRAQFRIAERWELGLGVDNLTAERYFLFHPFPQRSFAADLRLRL